MPTKTKDLYCIQVNQTTFEDGKQSDIHTSFISFTRFKKSFIDEKWENEYRTNPKYTLFGQQFTTTTVNFSDTNYNIRQFIFPDSIESAEQLHELHKPDQY